jgi:AcrR family transcriptional regulator
VREPVKQNLRDRRRADTETRLVAAATELFIRDGYAAATLTAVAERADLAARTVYVHFPTKADLLRRCIGVAIGGDTAETSLADREFMRETLTARSRRERIRLMARVTAGLMERAGPLLRVAQQAEATEPIIAAAAQAGRDDTKRFLGQFWRQMAKDGLLPAKCDLEWLTDTATLLAHGDTYLLLTKTTSWNIATYEAWLATTWTRLVKVSASNL